MWHNAASGTATNVPGPHTAVDAVLRLGKSESIGNRNTRIIEFVCRDAGYRHPSLYRAV